LKARDGGDKQDYKSSEGCFFFFLLDFVLLFLKRRHVLSFTDCKEKLLRLMPEFCNEVIHETLQLGTMDTGETGLCTVMLGVVGEEDDKSKYGSRYSWNKVGTMVA